MKEAVTKVIDMLTQEDFQKLLERYNKCIAAGGDYFQGTGVSCVYYQYKYPHKKSLETYLMVLVYVNKQDLDLDNLQWSNGCRRWKWTRRTEFKSLMRRFVFRIPY